MVSPAGQPHPTAYASSGVSKRSAVTPLLDQTISGLAPSRVTSTSKLGADDARCSVTVSPGR